MKRTYNINIYGRVFTIDEDAYKLLNEYLETLRHAFPANAGNDELLADIEARIAEIFQEKINCGFSVITIEDVQAIITRIGKPEVIAEEIDREYVTEDGSTVHEETVREEETPPPYNAYMGDNKKRLYRDTQNGMIGGVCAGLAVYLGVDVTWVRLITVGLCFLSLSTLAVLYGVLWIVVPDARTPLQRMSMHGVKTTVSNIGKAVTDMFGNKNEKSKTNETARDETVNINSSETSAGAAPAGLAKFFGTLGKILLVLFLIVAIPLEIALIVGLAGCVFALLIFGTLHFTAPKYFFTTSTDEQSMIIGLFCAIGYIIVFGLPLFLLISRSLAPSRNFWKKPGSSAFIILWVAGFILAAITTGTLIGLNW